MNGLMKNTPVKDRKLQSVEEKFNDYTKICGGAMRQMFCIISCIYMQ